MIMASRLLGLVSLQVCVCVCVCVSVCPCAYVRAFVHSLVRKGEGERASERVSEVSDSSMY